MNWMQENEPRLYAEIDGRREDVLDFLRVKDFSYASDAGLLARSLDAGRRGRRASSTRSTRPARTSSPTSNSFSNELICHDLDGGEGDLEERVEFYNDFFFKLFNPTIHLYRDQYQLFGNAQVMVAKVVVRQPHLLHAPRLPVRAREAGEDRGHREVQRDRRPGHPAARPHAGAVPRLARARARPSRRACRCSRSSSSPISRRRRRSGSPATDDELLERADAEHRDDQGARRVDLPQGGAATCPTRPTRTPAINPLAISLKPEQWEEDGLFVGRRA